MSIRTLVELNHDHTSSMNSDEFLLALAAYLRNPTEDRAYDLSCFGATVYGTAHHEDTQIRGFRSPFERKWFKVTNVINEL